MQKTWKLQKRGTLRPSSRYLSEILHSVLTANSSRLGIQVGDFSAVRSLLRRLAEALQPNPQGLDLRTDLESLLDCVTECFRVVRNACVASEANQDAALWVPLSSKFISKVLNIHSGVGIQERYGSTILLGNLLDPSGYGLLEQVVLVDTVCKEKSKSTGWSQGWQIALDVTPLLLLVLICALVKPHQTNWLASVIILHRHCGDR